MNKRITLIARPKGYPTADLFRLDTLPVPEPEDGQLLVGVEMISLDPAIRGWMNEGTTYIPGIALGDVVRAFSAGKVLASKHPDFKEGMYVAGLLGAQTHTVHNGKGLTVLDLNTGPLEWHLGVLGMPGMTAYFGLLERGRPQAGETVFISGAAGIIGMTVGQIAKIKGCRVVGTAGSAEKCRFLTEACGFDAAINYKTEDVRVRLSETCPDGIHVFFDNVGGPMLDMGLGCLGRGARVVICGAISQYNNSEIYGPKNYMKIVTARGTITGIIVFDFQGRYPEAVADLSQWLKSGQMITKTDLYEGIENFPDTLMKLYTGDNFGKLLLKV